MKLLAVLILAGLTALVLYLMRRGWVKRERSIVLDPLPELPSGPWEGEAHTCGIYVTTTLAGMPYERVITRGLGHKSAVEVYVRTDGVLLHRQGEVDLFIPVSDLTAVKTTSGMIGKFAAADSIVVLQWRVGQSELDTGIHVRCDEERGELIARLTDLLAPPPGSRDQ